MIVAIVSFWDEHPDDLRKMIASLRGLCDRAVFLDGRYRDFPDPRTQSPIGQYAAILETCRTYKIQCALEQPTVPFTGNEVAKRARLFTIALTGLTPQDWLLRIDPDEHIHHHYDVRAQLDATDLDVAEVTATGKSASEIDRSLGVDRTWRHRALFRALPDITCTDTHWRYTAGGRDLWGPGQHMAPALDLTGSMTIAHRYRRNHARTEQASAYYQRRDTEGFER